MAPTEDTHPNYIVVVAEPRLGLRPPRPMVRAPRLAPPSEHASAILAAIPVSSPPTLCPELLETSPPPSGTYSVVDRRAHSYFRTSEFPPLQTQSPRRPHPTRSREEHS